MQDIVEFLSRDVTDVGISSIFMFIGNILNIVFLLPLFIILFYRWYHVKLNRYDHDYCGYKYRYYSSAEKVWIIIFSTIVIPLIIYIAYVTSFVMFFAYVAIVIWYLIYGAINYKDIIEYFKDKLTDYQAWKGNRNISPKKMHSHNIKQYKNKLSCH